MGRRLLAQNPAGRSARGLRSAEGLIELCEFLPWDTEFFGERIGRARIHRMNVHTANTILEWCAAQSIRCLYFLADSDDPETVRVAEDHAFHLMDIRVTSEHKMRSVAKKEIAPSPRR